MSNRSSRYFRYTTYLVENPYRVAIIDLDKIERISYELKPDICSYTIAGQRFELQGVEGDRRGVKLWNAFLRYAEENGGMDD